MQESQDFSIYGVARYGFNRYNMLIFIDDICVVDLLGKIKKEYFTPTVVGVLDESPIVFIHDENIKIGSYDAIPRGYIAPR